MLPLSYNISSRLVDKLSRIDKLRRDIYLSLIPPKQELRFRWEASFRRIFLSLELASYPVKKVKMLDLLTNPTKKITTLEERRIYAFKKAFDYIRQNWFINRREVFIGTLDTISEILTLNHISSNFRKILPQALEYIQRGNVHPVVCAGMCQYVFEEVPFFNSPRSVLGRMGSYLFFYKLGYDMRDLLVMEEQWLSDLEAYKSAITEARKRGNLTVWFEYYTQCFERELSRILSSIEKHEYRVDVEQSFFQLNDRQREILLLFDQPDFKITNRMIQKKFSISQITASRDLAKLASLGLVFARGRGRSVYYTKV